MHLATIVIALAIFVALWLFFGTSLRENFFPNTGITVTWAPSTPGSEDIAYNWGVCILSGPSTGFQSGRCAQQNPVYPPGTPGPQWQYKGQTARGASSLILDKTKCGQCSTGQVIALQLQAVNLANPSIPPSEWAAFTIDLTSKSTVVRNSISDSTDTSMALYPGSTGFTYILQLNQPAFDTPNEAIVSVSVLRGGSSFLYSSPVPFTSKSPDGTTGVYTASFLTVSPNASWTPSAPGANQVGDVVTVTTSVTDPGTPSKDGEVFFSGSLSQTVVSVKPSAPTGVIWNIA